MTTKNQNALHAWIIKDILCLSEIIFITKDIVSIVVSITSIVYSNSACAVRRWPHPEHDTPASAAGRQHCSMFTYDQLSSMVYRCDEIGKYNSSSSSNSRLLARPHAAKVYRDCVVTCVLGLCGESITFHERSDRTTIKLLL